MAAPRAVQEASIALVRDRRPEANEHKSMLQNRYISVSQLVQQSAEKLAAMILADEPDGDSSWAGYGNARADWNLANVPHQEHKLVVPLDTPGEDEEFPGVDLEGHYDGLALHNDAGEPYLVNAETQVSTVDAKPSLMVDTGTAWASIYENKAPLHEPDAWKINAYYEQGAAYLAMLDEMVLRGVTHLEPAEWKKEQGRLELPKDLEPAQVVVCVQPASADKFEQAYPETRDHLAKHLDKLREKGRAVWASVEANDPTGPAREWDLKNPSKKPEKHEITEEDAERAMKAKFHIQACIKALENRKKDHDAVITQHLIGMPERKAKVLGVTVKIQEDAGGVRHYVQKPSWKLQTWGKIKEA